MMFDETHVELPPMGLFSLGGLTLQMSQLTAGTVPLIDTMGIQPKARLSGPEFLARALASYDDPDLKFLSAEFENRWPGETVCIHGSGPSIENTFPELLELIAGGAKLCAVNASYPWLTARGLIPEFAILADPKPFVAEYLDPHPSTIVLVNSGCHSDVIAKFKKHKRTLIWHALNAEAPGEVLAQAHAIMAKSRETGRGAYVCEGGSTTTQRAMDVFRFLGFRHERFFGVDSSGKRDGDTLQMHGHHKPHVVAPQPRPVYVKDPTTGKDLPRRFWSNSPMEHQAIHWEIILRKRFEQMKAGDIPPFEVVVHGDGLWPALAAMYGLHADPGYADRLRAEPSEPMEDPRDD